MFHISRFTFHISHFTFHISHLSKLLIKIACIPLVIFLNLIFFYEKVSCILLSIGFVYQDLYAEAILGKLSQQIIFFLER